MINTGKLAGRTLFITGASRGIGKAIALKAAKDGANIVIAAKTAEPHPKLPGTIFTAAAEIESVGGKALPCVVDVRDENSVKKAVNDAVSKFGGIDIVVNNASAISLTATADTEMKRYDLMHQINTRGTFLVSKECLPYLKKSNHAHILNLSPPLNMSPIWFSRHVAYTMAKYGMSMCVLGMAEEFKPFNIGVNALWPRTAISTAAMDMLGGKETANYSRKPDIVSDAAYAILIEDPKTTTGNFFIDEDVLIKKGVTDLDQYVIDITNKDNLILDFFIQEAEASLLADKGDQPKILKDDKIATLMKKMYNNFSPELAAKIDALYQFNLTGKDAGSWYLELRKGKELAYGKGTAPNKPDATLTIDSDDLFNLLTGKINGATAYMSGKLKISGNLQKSMKLQKLSESLRSKL